jgi:hypothetical protein
MTSQQSIPVADIYPFDTAAAPSSRLFQRLDVILHSVRSHLDKQDTLSGQHRQGEIQERVKIALSLTFVPFVCSGHPTLDES